jgi:hypothetical protein
VDLVGDEAKGKAKGILEILEEYGQVPEELVIRIQEEKNLEQLSRWLKFSAKVSRIEEFIMQMD